MGWFTDTLKAVAPALIGAGVSTYISNKAADTAQKQTQAATNAAIAAEDRKQVAISTETAQQRAMQDWAFTRLKGLSDGSIDPTASPGAQHRKKERDKAIERAASAGGILESGRTKKDLVRWGDAHAESEFSGEFNRVLQMANLGNGGQAANINAIGGNNTAGLLLGQGGNNATITANRNASNTSNIQNVMDAFARSDLLSRL